MRRTHISCIKLYTFERGGISRQHQARSDPNPKKTTFSLAGRFLLHLGVLGEAGAEHAVPELAGDAERELVLEVVVRHVIPLELLVPERRAGEVNPVVRHVVADVPKQTAAEAGGPRVPVVEEDGVGEGPERRAEDAEQGRGHDEAVLVHGEVVVNSMKQEMQRNSYSVVGKIAIRGRC